MLQDPEVIRRICDNLLQETHELAQQFVDRLEELRKHFHNFAQDELQRACGTALESHQLFANEESASEAYSTWN